MNLKLKRLIFALATTFLFSCAKTHQIEQLDLQKMANIGENRSTLPEHQSSPRLDSHHDDVEKSFSFSDHLDDPCQFRSLSSMPTPKLRRVFENDQTEQDKFELTYLENPTEALKKWLKSTVTFSDIDPTSDFEFIKKHDQGWGHSGVYEILLPGRPELQYILKISKHDSEAQTLWKIQNSMIGHPECFLRGDLPISRVATQEELSFFPRIPRVLEAARFTDAAVILLEKAPGKHLPTFVSEQERLAAFRAAGKSLGYFHYFFSENPNLKFNQWKTFTHGDLHGYNVFYDDESKVVSFIDNETIGSDRTIWHDFDMLAHQQLNYTINNYPHNSSSVLLPYARTLQDDYARRMGIQIAFLEDCASPAPAGTLHPSEAILSTLEDPVILREIPAMRPQQVTDRFNEFNSVVLGYLEAFPSDKQSEVREYFGQMCRDSANVFTRNFSTDEFPSARLSSAITQLFPAGMNACLENRFE